MRVNQMFDLNIFFRNIIKLQDYSARQFSIKSRFCFCFCSLRNLLNYCTIIQNLYSSPAAINVSEGLHLKQLLILYSSLSLLSLCHSCILPSLKLSLVQFASNARW